MPDERTVVPDYSKRVTTLPLLLSPPVEILLPCSSESIYIERVELPLLITEGCLSLAQFESGTQHSSIHL
jgi:hypothetical protein